MAVMTKKQVSDLGKRLKEAREECEFTQSDLELISGVSQQKISNIESGVTQSSNDVAALALSCLVTPEWLEFGKWIHRHRWQDDILELSSKEKRVECLRLIMLLLRDAAEEQVNAQLKALRTVMSEDEIPEKLRLDTRRQIARVAEDVQDVPIDTLTFIANTEVAAKRKSLVPVISFVQAGSWAEISDSFEPGDADEWISVTDDYGPHTYALRIVGDSMTNPAGLPTFPHGCTVIVDPSKPLENNRFIIARLEQTSEATFKRYREDAGQRHLVPLNPKYDPIPITSEMTYCGRVVKIAELDID